MIAPADHWKLVALLRLARMGFVKELSRFANDVNRGSALRRAPALLAMLDPDFDLFGPEGRQVLARYPSVFQFVRWCRYRTVTPLVPSGRLKDVVEAEAAHCARHAFLFGKGRRKRR